VPISRRTGKVFRRRLAEIDEAITRAERTLARMQQSERDRAKQRKAAKKR
jgi:F0F1-type ATP synthase membrane subunit b/b'